MFDRCNAGLLFSYIGVVHIAFMSVDMFALTNDIYIRILCELHVFFVFVGFSSFDTTDSIRIGTVPKYLRLFDLIFCVSFGWFSTLDWLKCLLMFQERTVLRRTFGRKLHLICQKKYKKRNEVANQKESVQYKQAYRSLFN